jgi:hypothetical protein
MKKSHQGTKKAPERKPKQQLEKTKMEKDTQRQNRQTNINTKSDKDSRKL